LYEKTAAHPLLAQSPDEKRSKNASSGASGLSLESDAMFHTIKFAADLTVDLEVSPKQHLERLRIRKGARLQAQIKPYVVETEDGPVEVADLFFEDGTTTRTVPFNSFAFVD
jgi:hypothetical protein